MPDDLELRFPYECTTVWSWLEVANWCEDNVGRFDQDWYRYGTDIMYGIDAPAIDRYRFRTEQAAILFRLRWS